MVDDIVVCVLAGEGRVVVLMSRELGFVLRGIAGK